MGTNRPAVRGERFTAVMAAVVGSLPFGLAEVITPTVLGFAIINGFTFAVDISCLTAIQTAARPSSMPSSPLARPACGPRWQPRPTTTQHASESKPPMVTSTGTPTTDAGKRPARGRLLLRGFHLVQRLVRAAHDAAQEVVLRCDEPVGHL